MGAHGNGRTLIRGPEDFAAAFAVSRQTIDRLAAYEQLLRQWQKTVNLVAPSTLDAMWHRHFADSAQLLPLAPRARTCVDLGSGAGFPGLVVAILMAQTDVGGVPSLLAGEGQGGGDDKTSAVAVPPAPNPSPQGGGEPPTPSPRKQGEGTKGRPRITLIESNARKCAFLREVVRKTGITARVAVEILSTRIEVAATQASLQGAEVVSARAVAPLDKLLNLAAHLFTPRTVGLFLKGRDAAAELKAAEAAWKFAVQLVPSRTERDAHIVMIRDLEPRPKTKRKGMNP